MKTYKPNQKVIIPGIPHNHKRIDRTATIMCALPWDPAYYQVSIPGLSDDYIVHESYIKAKPLTINEITPAKH